MLKRLAILTALLCATVSVSWAGATGGHGDAAPHWGYEGAGAPEHWGSLDPAFSTCSIGESQSPINVTGGQDVDQPAIAFSYKATPIHMVNNGHTIKVDYAPGSTITVSGKTYNLLQFHFHTQSENAIEGKLFPMEAHLVHSDADGHLAVVGVMFADGAANPFIEQLWLRMPVAANSTMDIAGSLNVETMLPESRDYYSWSGSLTTPPCSEGVAWMLLKQPVTIAPGQAAKLKRVMGGENNRPLQPLNGRVIYK